MFTIEIVWKNKYLQKFLKCFKKFKNCWNFIQFLRKNVQKNVAKIGWAIKKIRFITSIDFYQNSVVFFTFLYFISFYTFFVDVQQLFSLSNNFNRIFKNYWLLIRRFYIMFNQFFSIFQQFLWKFQFFSQSEEFLNDFIIVSSIFTLFCCMKSCYHNIKKKVVFLSIFSHSS